MVLGVLPEKISKSVSKPSKFLFSHKPSNLIFAYGSNSAAAVFAISIFSSSSSSLSISSPSSSISGGFLLIISRV